jgi:hypothetical protein
VSVSAWHGMAGREDATADSARAKTARRASVGWGLGTQRCAANVAQEQCKNNMARRDNYRQRSTARCSKQMGVETYGCSRPQQSSVTRFCGGEERDSRLTGHWLRGRQDATLVLPTRASTCEKQFCAGQHAVWKRRADAQRYPVVV